MMTIEDIKRINVNELIDDYVRSGYSWDAAITKAYQDKAAAEDNNLDFHKKVRFV